MKKVRMRILIEGRLQGTNFRYHTQTQAEKLKLVGFVRILSDGRIEVDVQGPEEQIQELLDWYQQGPHGSHIKTILYRYDEVTERYSNFSAR